MGAVDKIQLLLDPFGGKGAWDWDWGRRNLRPLNMVLVGLWLLGEKLRTRLREVRV